MIQFLTSQLFSNVSFVGRNSTRIGLVAVLIASLFLGACVNSNPDQRKWGGGLKMNLAHLQDPNGTLKGYGFDHLDYVGGGIGIIEAYELRPDRTTEIEGFWSTLFGHMVGPYDFKGLGELWGHFEDY